MKCCYSISLVNSKPSSLKIQIGNRSRRLNVTAKNAHHKTAAILEREGNKETILFARILFRLYTKYVNLFIILYTVYTILKLIVGSSLTIWDKSRKNNNRVKL